MEPVQLGLGIRWRRGPRLYSPFMIGLFVSVSRAAKQPIYSRSMVSQLLPPGERNNSIDLMKNEIILLSLYLT